MGFRKTLRKVTHGIWVQMQESGAIRMGQRVELDPRYTGDRFAPSPAVGEVIREDYSESETTEIHETRKVDS